MFDIFLISCKKLYIYLLKNVSFNSRPVWFLNATCFAPNQVRTYRVRTPVLILNFLFHIHIHLFWVSFKVSGLKNNK